MNTSDETSNAAAYWRANLKLLAGLLTVWFLVSYGCGIFLADVFDQFHIGGYPLGFFIAQQGSIYVFIVLIFVYVWRMNKLDRQFNLHEEE